MRSRHNSSRAMTSRKAIRTVLLIALASFLGFTWMKSRTIQIREDDWQAECYLKALFPHLLAFKQVNGRWPTKQEVRESDLASAKDCDGEPIPKEALIILWRDCTLLQPIIPTGALAHIPSDGSLRGQRSFIILDQTGETDRDILTVNPVNKAK